jgi:hypothetical protein
MHAVMNHACRCCGGGGRFTTRQDVFSSILELI